MQEKWEQGRALSWDGHQGADEFKQTKIDIKMLIFLQFLLHLSMWCHFNGM
jgi:hypothetical protein